MLSWLRRRREDKEKAREIYGAVVAAARSPRYYRDLGVPDTPEGRYEMIVLFLSLVLLRLNAAGTPGKPLAQALAEAFVADMDDAMREMGVGDLTVPRKVKRAAAGLYDRMQAYGVAVAAGDAAFAEALAAAVPELAGPQAEALAATGRAVQRELASVSDVAILDGRLTFSDT